MNKALLSIGFIIALSLLLHGGARTAALDSANSLRSSAYSNNPFDGQVAEQINALQSDASAKRAGAAEALGFMRAYESADALVAVLGDRDPNVRREAALALAWCGDRASITHLIKALEDRDWVVRQAACVSLNNLTGMEFPFDALADDATRATHINPWQSWWASAPAVHTPTQLLNMINDPTSEVRLRAARALGSLGGGEATPALLHAFKPYHQREYDSLDNLDKHVAQSCIRSLGRLRNPQALVLLIGLLDSPDWARYAADALGDFGSTDAVAPLIAAYPLFSRDLNNPFAKPIKSPVDDCFTGDNTQDRMLETPYAIAQALTRLVTDDPEHRTALRGIAPHLLANLPSDWDGGMLYEPESFEHITAYLLQKADLADTPTVAVFAAADDYHSWFTLKPAPIAQDHPTTDQLIAHLARRSVGDVPNAAAWLPALCRDPKYIPQLLELLTHDNGWFRINAIKALMFLDAQEAVESIATLLVNAPREAEYGFSGVLEHSEYDDPAPRWREACIRALGRLNATPHTQLLIEILDDDRNVIDIRYAAAQALIELGTPVALDALKTAEKTHPFQSIRTLAREILWQKGLLDHSEVDPRMANVAPAPSSQPLPTESQIAPPKAYVFIKGEKKMRSNFNAQGGVDPWRQTYTVNNPAPTMRVGRNLYILRKTPQGDRVTALTRFEQGYIADCEVSWDGRKIIFAYRRNNESRNYSQVPYDKPTIRPPADYRLDGSNDPWWHLWEIGADGTGLRQITHGPYHDVHPVYLADGRIAFTSTRLGLRDEYHGYPATGLAIANADGSDIRVIGFNFGADRDPAVLPDGRIVFSRLDVFYSRLKSEITVQAVYPDGTKNIVLYGPERRGYWMDVHRKNAAWTQRTSYANHTDNRNRVLRMSQPQPLSDGRIVCATSGGLVVVGPGRTQERLIPHDRLYAVTSPFPLNDQTLVCAATVKRFNIDGQIVNAGTPQFEKLAKGPRLFRSAIDIDHALYTMDIQTGAMTLLYNDPDTADFEPRPLIARPRPASPAEGLLTYTGAYTAKLVCTSAFNSREQRVATRGKLLRVIEGQAVVSRHENQNSLNSSNTNRWKNHAGTHARVLGTVPLAADGSFFIEVPADRLLQLQVLDADRRVLGNQTFWMYARPGETRSCIGCHERPDISNGPTKTPLALLASPLQTLPNGDEFSYRAKFWLKGIVPDEAEDRNRTVRAVNLIGRN